MKALGVAPATIRWWVGTGYAIPVLPRVYAVGHVTRDQPARLLSLALFAGPGAALSHGTAAHWRGWLRYPVRATHLSTPRRLRTRLPGVIVHCERDLERELVNGIPCTAVTQTLLDLAATEQPRPVNRALAQLDYARALDAGAVRAICRRGRPGSARLFDALATYMPDLAHTKSELEDEYLYVCQRFGIPLPEVNPDFHGEEPDCLWRDLGLVVELDGGGNHAPPRNVTATSARPSSCARTGPPSSATQRTRSSTRLRSPLPTPSPNSSSAAGLASDSNILVGTWIRSPSSTT